MQDEKTRIDYLYINDEGLAGDGRKKNIKSISSKRRLPVHSILKTIGFMEFVEARRAADGVQAVVLISRARLTRADWPKQLPSGSVGATPNPACCDAAGSIAMGVTRTVASRGRRHSTLGGTAARCATPLQAPHPVHGAAIAEFEMDFVTGHAPGGWRRGEIRL